MINGQGINGADVAQGYENKIFAGKIATSFGADMVICNGNNVDNINHILEGKSRNFI